MYLVQAAFWRAGGAAVPQQRLYLRLEPQGHGALRGVSATGLQFEAKHVPLGLQAAEFGEGPAQEVVGLRAGAIDGGLEAPGVFVFHGVDVAGAAMRASMAAQRRRCQEAPMGFNSALMPEQSAA
jgi:hypothetical protein